MQGTDPGLDARGVARLATALAVAVLLAGLAMLLAYSVAEAIANPGYSIVDGYWRGRLPWMGIIEGLVVAGATACVLVGGATVLVLGGWWRRAVVLVPLLLAALWWVAARGRAGITGGGCPNCPPSPFDPWAYAYSVPESAALGLILPALAIAVLALTVPAARSATPLRDSPP
jgi:hypothetical protein